MSGKSLLKILGGAMLACAAIASIAVVSAVSADDGEADRLARAQALFKPLPANAATAE